MAGPVKTVCFITSLVIAWGLFEVGEAIVAWFDYKINGTEIPWNLQFGIKIPQMCIILYQGLFLYGLIKEKSMFMEIWLQLYCFFTLFGFIPIGILGIKMIVNLYLFADRFENYFEISIFQYHCICIYLAVQLYGTWVFEIYKTIKEKEEAKEDAEFKKRVDKLMAEIDKKVAKNKETKEIEKNTISEKDPGMLV